MTIFIFGNLFYDSITNSYTCLLVSNYESASASVTIFNRQKDHQRPFICSSSVTFTAALPVCQHVKCVRLENMPPVLLLFNTLRS